MKHPLLLFCCFLALGVAARASTLPPGIYDQAGQHIYVGVEHELPDPTENEFFNPANQRTGTLESHDALRVRTGVHEERRIIMAPQGRLGVSLYYAGTAPRATVMLIHGSDAETREMGFIIPFFVCNGVNVISYDQRGTGDSTGNWFLNGPVQRAQDATAIYDAFRSDQHVDSKHIGVWGFSNGGWTAPIVAIQRPIAFMILKSAPAESVMSNIDYEVVQEMRRHGESQPAIRHALELWHAIEGALFGTQSWSEAKRVYDDAVGQPWFSHSLMIRTALPPSAQIRAGLRRAFSYDPAQTLQKVHVPTLALYGGVLDYRLDSADSSARMRRYFQKAGMRDFTMHVYPDGGHTLTLSKNDRKRSTVQPERYVPGYPQIMLTWLAQRGLIKRNTP